MKRFQFFLIPRWSIFGCKAKYTKNRVENEKISIFSYPEMDYSKLRIMPSSL